ncbi:hypothetical protein SUGI_1044030 [Cryptomeria japonica]|nr:hypothetical protein SUGI_1044030 [Cryptomeria japonica]
MGGKAEITGQCKVKIHSRTIGFHLHRPAQELSDSLNESPRAGRFGQVPRQSPRLRCVVSNTCESSFREEGWDLALDFPIRWRQRSSILHLI